MCRLSGRCYAHSTSIVSGHNYKDVLFPTGAKLSLTISSVINILINKGWFDVFFRLDSAVNLDMQTGAAFCKDTRRRGTEDDHVTHFSVGNSNHFLGEKYHVLGGNLPGEMGTGQNKRLLEAREVERDEKVSSNSEMRSITSFQTVTRYGSDQVVYPDSGSEAFLPTQNQTNHMNARSKHEKPFAENDASSILRSSSATGISTFTDSRVHLWGKMDLYTVFLGIAVQLIRSSTTVNTVFGSLADLSPDAPAVSYRCYDSQQVRNGAVGSLARGLVNAQGGTLDLGRLVCARSRSRMCMVTVTITDSRDFRCVILFVPVRVRCFCMNASRSSKK
jgi:hypothetical protein